MLEPLKFRKKPVVVEMMRWDGSPEVRRALDAWVGHTDSGVPAFMLDLDDPTGIHELARLWVAHNDSWSPLPVGYFVAREVDGSGFHPLSPDGHAAGYEPEVLRTAASQKPAVAAGWLPPHRVERLRTYLEHLASEGTTSMEAAIVSAILDGEDPDY